MITIKTPEEIEEFRRCDALSKAALRMAGTLVRPGVSTKEIDSAVEGFIRLHGGVPSFKGLYGFPGSICASANMVQRRCSEGCRWACFCRKT